MQLNIKTVLIGGIVFYAASWVIGFGTGALIHEGVLDAAYRATESFWRPELAQDPPDMAALMPRWIATGLIAAFILVGIYDNIRGALEGPGWLKGLKFGVVLSLIYATTAAGWSGVFSLPNSMWAWWAFDALLVYCFAATVLGWYVGKWGSD